MNALLLLPQTTVEEVFQYLPQATQVFIHYQTDCVGCRLARFCTLENVADIYTIDLSSFLGALQQELPNTNKNAKE
jgi:hypothetical protein